MKPLQQLLKSKRFLTISVLPALLLAVAWSSLPTSLTVSAQGATPTVNFEQALYVVPENVAGGRVFLDVRVSGLVSGTVSVSYTFEEPDSNPAATFGDDYSSLTGAISETMSFDANNTTKQIEIIINDDDVVEDTEEFQVELTADSGVELGDVSFTVVRIENDDCNVNNTSPSAPELLLIPAQTTGSCLKDDQFFTFAGKAGKQYQISTNSSGNSIDTHLYLYSDAAFTDLLSQNDDANNTTFDSTLTFEATANQNYYVRVENKQAAVTDVSDLYTLSIILVDTGPTATPESATAEPTATRVPFDEFEDNFDFDSAYVIAPDTVYDLNFVPVSGSGPDNDFFKLWVKEGWSYSCETVGLSPYNDTNMIIYDQNRNGLAGNDDKAPGELGSLVDYTAAYTGWLYVLIGPNVEVNYNVSSEYAYQLECLSVFGTPTPTPWPVSQSSGAPAAAATAVPTRAPEITATPQVITPQAAVAQTELDTEGLQIVIQELPAEEPTPITLTTEDFVVIVTIDSADGQSVQGVSNIPIALYNQAGQLLAFGYTDTQGNLSVTLTSDTSEIEVVIPYFGIREHVQFTQTQALSIKLPSVNIGPTPAP